MIGAAGTKKALWVRAFTSVFPLFLSVCVCVCVCVSEPTTNQDLHTAQSVYYAPGLKPLSPYSCAETGARLGPSMKT